MKYDIEPEERVYCPRIVSIGGGTGLSTMLRGLKKYTKNITAVVSVADDGGGSGMLRDDLHMPPPGDIRNCILALAQTEPLMEKLLQYRFTDGSLSGQNFGNLFLAAMNGIFHGDFVTAVQKVSDVLKVTGKVLPVTDTDVELVADLEDGRVIRGESAIGCSVHEYGSKISRVQLQVLGHPQQEIHLVEEIAHEVAAADVITLGPGSLYTSILPNLAVRELTEAILQSKAPVVYINNIMTEPGETDGYTAFDHVQAILEHTQPDIVDYCIVNSQRVDTPLLSRYIEQDAQEVFLDEERFAGTGIRLVKRDLVSVKDGRYIRHNPMVLADTILDIVNHLHQTPDLAVSEEGVVLYKPRRRNESH